MAKKVYTGKAVDVALKERMAWIFDNYANVIVSVSGGKDSTVLFNAAQKEAAARSRTITCMFLDQEVEYSHTITHVRDMMTTGPHVKPMWWQAPIYMTNATSFEDEMLYAWGPGEEWLREKEVMSIHEVPGAPDRFYPFFEWIERQYGAETCFLVGLRSEESMNRYRAVAKNAAVPGIPWSSKTSGKAVRLYPLYDFTFEDIWTYLGKFHVKYNKIYDFMYAKGMSMNIMRVSNLIHEQAFHCLTTLQEFDFDTYEKLVRRLKGVHTAAKTADQQSMYQTLKRPKAFGTWKAYRNSLLEALPLRHKDVFTQRFAGQKETESNFRQQCRQLLLNDYENSVPVINQDDEAETSLEKWMAIL